MLFIAILYFHCYSYKIQPDVQEQWNSSIQELHMVFIVMCISFMKVQDLKYSFQL